MFVLSPNKNTFTLNADLAWDNQTKTLKAVNDYVLSYVNKKNEILQYAPEGYTPTITIFQIKVFCKYISFTFHPSHSFNSLINLNKQLKMAQLQLQPFLKRAQHRPFSIQQIKPIPLIQHGLTILHRLLTQL